MGSVSNLPGFSKPWDVGGCAPTRPSEIRATDVMYS